MSPSRIRVGAIHLSNRLRSRVLGGGSLRAGEIDPRELAICTIHGNSVVYGGDFGRAYAWPRLQIDRLRRHTPPGYTVYAYGHEIIPEHAAYLRECPEVRFIDARDVPNGVWPHVWPIRNWLLRIAARSHRWLLTLDSDAFPVRDGWLDRYVSALGPSSPVVAAQRLENRDEHSDRSFLLFSREAFREHLFDFSPVGVKDAGGAISAGLEERGLGWVKLRRTNRFDYHPLIAGIYDDHIYHHAAGSRDPRFRMNRDTRSDEAHWARERTVHRVLLKRLFDHTDPFLAELRGEAEPFDLEAAVASEPVPPERPPRPHGAPVGG